ncbi:MAG: hypothetical protein ACKO23_08705 [Gemmataceae bacterium]
MIPFSIALSWLGLSAGQGFGQQAKPVASSTAVGKKPTPSLVPTPSKPAVAPKPFDFADLISTSFQQPESREEEGRSEYQIQLEPPGLERISRLDSDAKLQERIRQEAKVREPNETLLFPESPILSRKTYLGRGTGWPRRNMLVEPNYVCYRKLYFQDLNAERYGWDLGFVHPFLATAKFWYDLALFPMHFAHEPCARDCSVGYCLPGDPVPFMLYPPEVTLRGSMAEVAVILALVAIVP